MDRIFRGDGDTFTIESRADVKPILDLNAHLRSETQKSDWGRHVAHIPPIILEKWLNEEWARGNLSIQYMDKEFTALVERKLKDPDWAYLRTDSAMVQHFIGFGS